MVFLKYRLRLYPLMFILFLLQGCSLWESSQVLLAPVSWNAHRERVLTIRKWRCSGRVSVRYAQTSESVNFYWKQQGTHYDILLLGPLGSSLAQLFGSLGGAITLKIPGQKTITAMSESALLSSTMHFNEPIPFQALRYWILGIPVAGPCDMKLEQGYLTDLSQSQWHLKYSRYKKVGHWILPTMLHVENNAHTIWIRLSIRWKTVT